MSGEIARREFIKYIGLGAGAVGAAAVLNPGILSAQGEPVEELAVDFQAVDDAHEAKVRTFQEQIGTDDNFWRKPLEFTMDGDVKVFELTCTELYWATEEGLEFPAFAYNGMVPGPEIRVTEGDHIRILVHNEMNQSTAIHWHGVHVPNAQDGVPFVTQDPIKPGETYTYEFVVPNSGTHMYHSHHNTLEQVIRGMLGAFIVEPKDKSREPHYDRDYTVILNDTFLGFTINGKSFPYVEPVFANLGERVRIRFMNEGLMIHPMHLHGMAMQVFAKDGYYLPAPYFCDTVNIAPGERYDVIVDCFNPGVWAFHCHIISHVETRDGLFGMTCPFIVADPSADETGDQESSD